MTTFSLLAARPRELCSIALLSFCLARMSMDQDGAVREPRDLPGDDLVVQLEPLAEGLAGSFELGPEEEQAPSRLIRVALSWRAPDALSHDRLSIDVDRDGRFSANEHFDAEPRFQRGSISTPRDAVNVV